MIKNVTIEKETYLAPLLYELGLGNYELKPGKWVIKLTKVRQVRSIQQNRMYWGYILPSIALEKGYEVEELHEYFKTLAGTKSITVGKTSKDVAISTRDMNTKEFTEYIDRIVQFVFHNEKIKIPKPGELTNSDIEEMEERYSNRYN